uniref:F-box domain-containing protein n=1 Tax=Steinernema glaseri TaxID=37863 RepID=A0A1I8AKT9_9BILA
MDRIPTAFYDQLCDNLSTDELSAAKELSGKCGKIARFLLENYADYSVKVVDGREEDGFLLYDYDNRRVHEPQVIKAAPKKLVQVVTINLIDANDEKVSREIVRRFPYSYYGFVHHSSSINEAWVDLANSLETLGVVTIMKELDNEALRLFQKLVISRKLTLLAIHRETLNRGIMEVSKSLLCQDQFDYLSIINKIDEHWNGAEVREILDLWSENSDQLKGKVLLLQKICLGGVLKLENFLKERKMSAASGILLRSKVQIENALTLCSQEECDFIKMEYNNLLFVFEKPSCFYKFEEGEAGNKRQFYVSFDCADEETRDEEGGRQQRGYPNFFGQQDLSLIWKTTCLHLLFVSREIVRRFPYSQHNFVHCSSSINQAWVDLAYSLKRLGSVTITKELDDDALRLFQKLVTSQKLTRLAIHAEACNTATMELSRTLFCQDQFIQLDIINEIDEHWNGIEVREILDLWSENSAQLKGKVLLLRDMCRGGIIQLENFLKERKTSTLPRNEVQIETVLTHCSKKECDFIRMEYNYSLFAFEKPSCFYKFEEGDKGNERRFYVTFECASGETEDESDVETTWKPEEPASFFGQKDLSLMRKTTCLHVLFG